MPLTTSRLLDSPQRQAERALRKPSSAVWLRSVGVRTARFSEALDFYVSVVGLTLGDLEAHPLTGRPRARLLDAEGHPILDLIEADGDAESPIHELALGMPRRTWTLLRARLNLGDVEATTIGSQLYLRDVDGNGLRIDAL